MTKYEKIFKALSDSFDVIALYEEVDDFETCLNEQGLEIVESKLETNYKSLLKASQLVINDWNNLSPDIILGDRINELSDCIKNSKEWNGNERT